MNTAIVFGRLGLFFAVALLMAWSNFQLWQTPIDFGAFATGNGGARTWIPSVANDVFEASQTSNKTSASHLLTRPLFSPTRRLTAPVVKKIRTRETVTKRIDSAYDPNLLSVTGILVVGKEKKALIKMPGKPEGQWVTTGNFLKNWQVTVIKNSYVQITSGRKKAKLLLYVEKPQ